MGVIIEGGVLCNGMWVPVRLALSSYCLLLTLDFWTYDTVSAVPRGTEMYMFGERRWGKAPLTSQDGVCVAGRGASFWLHGSRYSTNLTAVLLTVEISGSQINK